jgi:hypothetical protein
MAQVTFRLKEKDYELPDIISIGDYMKIFKVKDLFEDEYMKAKVVNLITNCPMDTLLEAENHKVEFLANTIFAMLPQPPYQLIDRFELDGIHYGYLPSYKEISFGEFIDLDTLLTRNPEEIIDNYHIITAMMYRPIISQKSEHNFKIEKYNVDTLEDRANIFKKKLDIRFALGGQFFFTNFAKIYTNFIPLSLIQKLRREWEAMKQLWIYRTLIWKIALKKDLDGMSHSIEYARITLKNTMKHLRKK